MSAFSWQLGAGTDGSARKASMIAAARFGPRVKVVAPEDPKMLTFANAVTRTLPGGGALVVSTAVSDAASATRATAMRMAMTAARVLTGAIVPSGTPGAHGRSVFSRCALAG